MQHLRFFLDASADTCLWSHNDDARKRFGYSVELSELALPPDLVVDIERLMADHVASIDWNAPARNEEPDNGLTIFGHETDAPFRERGAKLVRRLREALGPEFTIESDFEG